MTVEPKNRIALRRIEPTKRRAELVEDVVNGLAQSPKMIPSLHFYDERGSALFEQITELPEYYLTRSERQILEQRSGEIVEAAGFPLEIVEFGSGSSKKTRLLLQAAIQRQGHLTYVPIDISEEFLFQSSQRLVEECKGLSVIALAGEYLDALSALPETTSKRLFLFLGSSIGNMTEDEATAFLRQVRGAMKPHDRLLLGTDLAKDPKVLEAAYNDKKGVTAEFNLNLLRRINREIGADFDLNAFEHRAVWVPERSYIEMRLIGKIGQVVHIPGHGSFTFKPGEYIITEWSHKYRPESVNRLVSNACLEVCNSWRDREGRFELVLLAPIG